MVAVCQESKPYPEDESNLLTDGKFTYTWDAENRLIKAEYSDTRIEFVYDYMGRRTNKKLYVNNVLTSETKFTYDGWNLVAEYDGSNTLINSYLWGEDLSGSLQGAGGVGGLLSTTSYTSSMSYIPCYDGNGNITTYLDNSGNVVATYEYDPFGKIICAFGSKADNMAYRFSTKYVDKETSLYYYGYRYYNPETSRWLSRDPLGEDGGKNLYLFVNNNSISQGDILGLFVDRWDIFEWAFNDTINNAIDRFLKSKCNGSTDCGIPFARQLIRHYVFGRQQPFIRNNGDWGEFMKKRPQIKEAVDKKLKQWVKHFCKLDYTGGKFATNITEDVRLNTPCSMRFTLHGSHRISIKDDFSIKKYSGCCFVSFKKVKFSWIDVGDLHHGISTEDDNGNMVSDDKFSKIESIIKRVQIGNSGISTIGPYEINISWDIDEMEYLYTSAGDEPTQTKGDWPNVNGSSSASSTPTGRW